MLQNQTEAEKYLEENAKEPLGKKLDWPWEVHREGNHQMNLSSLLKNSDPAYIVVEIYSYDESLPKFYSAKSFLSTSSSTTALSESNHYYLLPILIAVVIVILLITIVLKKKYSQDNTIFQKFRVGRSSSTPTLNISPPSISSKKSKSTPYNDLNKQTDDADKSYINKDIVLSDDVVVPSITYSNIVKVDQEEEYANVSSSSFEEEQEILLNGFINSPSTAELFHTVPKDCGKPCLIATHPMNKLKNRYKNNLPYDETRIILPVVNDDPYSDYINANIMKGTDESKWYISSQGPKDTNQSTIYDFWRMIIHADVEIIVMVANFYEKRKLKVGEYFKSNEPLKVDGFTVNVLQRVQHPHFIRSIIEVCSDSEAKSKSVVHFQFIKWPDHGVPNQIFPLVFMVQKIIEEYKEGGIVVHCSAGIGRTGTILLVLLLKELHDAVSWIDPISVLRRMRDTRARLVENVPQFNLGLLVLYECLFGKVGSISTNDVDKLWDHYLQEASLLFDRLIKQPVLQSYTYGTNHISYNRNPLILPSDNHIVLYGSEDVENNPDYINAISINIEDVQNSIIITEHPMKSTINNFWEMIFAKKCSCVFLLNNIDECEEFPLILPLKEGFTDNGYYTLTVVKTPTSLELSGLIYSVNITKEKISHSVSVIQILDWTQDQECPNDISVIEKIACLIKDEANSSAPVVLCCSDGVTACGFVTAAVNIINRLDVYQELNVYNSVIKVRRDRPEFLNSKKQFLQLYEVAKLYLENNATYQNFQ